MELLTLNGLSFPLTQANAEPVRAGDVERGSNLAVRGGVRASAWDMVCATGLLPQDEARALYALVQGEGHVLSFDSTTTASSYLWSSRGAVPSTTVTPAVGSRVVGRNGGGALRVLEDKQVVWPGVCPSAEWTVLAWYHSNDEDAWGHSVWRSDGLTWVDGAGPFPGLAPRAYVTGGGALVLTHGGDLYQDWDEVVLLPYLVPDAWVAELYAFHVAHRWPGLPFLLAEGAAVPGGGSLEVQGRAGGVTREVGGPGTWLESFDFTLCGEP